MIKELHTRIYRKKRFYAFSLIFMFIITILSDLPSFAAPSATHVSNANYIHYKNTSYKTVTQFNNRINEIQSLTGVKPQNVRNQWLNPYIYDEYNNIIAYDLPFGDFMESKYGRMFELGTGKQGEYKYLGYDEGGNSITNDHYFSKEPVKKFVTYKEVNWQPVNGAENSWKSLSNEQVDYLSNTHFTDDEYGGSGYPPVMKNWLPDYRNKALVQVAPGLWRGASVRLEFNGNDWNTITWKPMGCSFFGTVIPVKSKYTLEAGENEVTIEVSITVDIAAEMKCVKAFEIDFLGKKQYITTTNANSYTISGFKKSFSRSELDIGLNNISLEGSLSLYSKFGEYKDKKISGSVTIEVIESPDPWVDAILVANPNTVQFNGDIIPIQLELTYGISNIKDLNKIEKVDFTISSIGNFVSTPSLVGEFKIVDYILPNFMNGYDTRDKVYEASVQYSLKDGSKYGDKSSAVVRVTRVPPEPTPTPGPTPTPTPVSTNNPPTVRLDAPSEVKAGDKFYVRAYASDPDNDPLTYEWKYENAQGTIYSSNYGTLWYDKKYANSNQEIEVFVYDGEDGALDSKVIRVLEPTVEARMKISGAYKVNRKITITDESKTPDEYPIIQYHKI